MTSIEEHLKIVDELEEDINEKISRNILDKRQKIIGFAASEASTNLFAVFLHKINLIESGFNVNHKFFASFERASEKFSYSFPSRGEILQKLVNQEKFRDLLCYGKSKEDGVVKEAVRNYFELKGLINSRLKEIENG